MTQYHRGAERFAKACHYGGLRLSWHWPWQKRVKPIRPPKVAGTRAPNRVLSVGFDRPHDYHIGFHGFDEILVFQSCTLVGFTTPMEDPNDVASPGEAW